MNTIHVREYGILPDTDVTLTLYDLFRRYPKDTEFIFENADYYFYPHAEMHADYRLSNSDPMPWRVLALWLKGMENITLIGNGARLWFAGQMQPVTLDNCRQIRMENFVIDWKKPLVAEGTVVGCGEDYADLFVDPALFPHRFTNGWLEFDTGANEWYPLLKRSLIQFDGNNRCVSAQGCAGLFNLVAVTGMKRIVFCHNAGNLVYRQLGIHLPVDGYCRSNPASTDTS